MRLLSTLFRAALLATGISLFTAGATQTAHAAFLIDPTGGTSLTAFVDTTNAADVDDGSLLRSLGGTFSLYGTNVTSIYVQTDGFLSVTNGAGFLNDRSVAALATSVGGSVLAPYYDDLYLDTSLNNSIIEKVVAGSYYSVTYSINGYTDTTAAAVAQFQATLFTGATTVKGVSYLPGDIVYSYAGLTNTVQGNFSVGVAQNGTTATNAFGVAGGQFTTNASFLSNFNVNTQAILLRASGGSYAQSLVSTVVVTVPETGTLALVGMAALPLVGAVIRRRKAI